MALQRPPVVKLVGATHSSTGVAQKRSPPGSTTPTSGGGIPALVLREPADAKPPLRTPSSRPRESSYVTTADEELVARYRVSDPGPLLGVDVERLHIGLSPAQTKRCEMRCGLLIVEDGRLQATNSIGTPPTRCNNIAAHRRLHWFNLFNVRLDGAASTSRCFGFAGLDGSSVTACLAPSSKLRSTRPSWRMGGSYEDWVNAAVEEVEKAALRAEASRRKRRLARLRLLASPWPRAWRWTWRPGVRRRCGPRLAGDGWDRRPAAPDPSSSPRPRWRWSSRCHRTSF